MSEGAPTIESVSAGVTAPAGEAVSVTQGGACNWAAIVQERLLSNVAPLAEEVEGAPKQDLPAKQRRRVKQRRRASESAPISQATPAGKAASTRLSEVSDVGAREAASAWD